MGTTTTIGRLKLIHPDLGFEGGVTLEGHVKSTLQKTSDAINSRYFEALDLNNSASVDFEHNFKCAFSEIKVLLYNIDGGGELTRITKGGSPDLDNFVIVGKVGFLTTHITVTNNTGSQQDICAVLVHGKGAEVLNDLSDVDTTGKEDGQTLVFENGSQKFKPGASGDSSFKFQKLTGTVLTIKKGYLALSNGEEIYSSADLSADLATFIPGANADYYGYFDRMTFPAYTTVLGRRVIAMTTSQLVFSTTTPDDQNLSRYIPIGKVQKAAGVFTNIETLATRRHDVALGADKSLEYTLPLQAIGAVGSAGQIAAGHELLAASFPSGAISANLSWYNLANVSDASGNARSLTNNGSATFDTDILGQASKAASLNGSSQYLSIANTLFNPGNIDWACAGWFYKADWTTGTVALFGQWETGVKSFFLNMTSGTFILYATTNGSTELNNTVTVPLSTGWIHLVLKYVASTNTFFLYCNAKQIMQFTLPGNLYSSGTGVFVIGAVVSTSPSQFFGGKIDELMFGKYAWTDNDIAKLYASKLTHSRTLSPISQDWKIDAQSVGGQNRDLFDVIVDKDANDLYFDLSDEVSTTQVELKLYNKSSVGLSKSAKPRTLEMTVDLLDALLPITHGLGVVPEISFKVKNTSNDYEYHDAGSLFVATATQIKLAGDTLTTSYGTGVVVCLTFATAHVSQFIPNRFWNKIVASSAVGLSVNDRLFADAATAFIATLPANPSIGDECQILDAKGTFGVVNYVTLNPGASNLRGGANTFDCNQPNKLYRAIFVDATYGWDILY